MSNKNFQAIDIKKNEKKFLKCHCNRDQEFHKGRKMMDGGERQRQREKERETERKKRIEEKGELSKNKEAEADTFIMERL